MFLLLIIEIKGGGQLPSRVTPQWNTQISPESSFTPEMECDQNSVWILCRIIITSQLWSTERGCQESLRRHRPRQPRYWPAGTWCWRTPPPAPRTSSPRGRKQPPSTCNSILKPIEFYDLISDPPALVLRYFEGFLCAILYSFYFQHRGQTLGRNEIEIRYFPREISHLLCGVIM